MDALTAYLRTGPSSQLVLLLNVEQGHHYFDQAMRRESQEDFIRGWLKRVSISKRGGLDDPNAQTEAT